MENLRKIARKYADETGTIDVFDQFKEGELIQIGYSLFEHRRKFANNREINTKYNVSIQEADLENNAWAKQQGKKGKISRVNFFQMF